MSLLTYSEPSQVCQTSQVSNLAYLMLQLVQGLPMFSLFTVNFEYLYIAGRGMGMGIIALFEFSAFFIMF